MSSHDSRTKRTLVGGMIELVECSFEYEEFTLAHPFKRIPLLLGESLIIVAPFGVDYLHCLKCLICILDVVGCSC